MAGSGFWLPLALEGDWADFRAVVVVLIGVAAWFGTIYALLASNLGWKVGYLVLMVALAGWTVLFSLIWLIGVPGTLPGTGPRTHEPKWVPFLADSEQAKEFPSEIGRFPEGWDEVGRVYAGNITSLGELETVTGVMQKALANLAKASDLEATDEDDWGWRLPGEDVVTPEQGALPVATVRFYQEDTPLLFGVDIPGTDKHRAITVFAVRDKGATFLDALYFLLVGIAGFVLHLWLLVRDERKQKAAEAAAAQPVTA